MWEPDLARLITLLVDPARHREAAALLADAPKSLAAARLRRKVKSAIERGIRPFDLAGKLTDHELPVVLRAIGPLLASDRHRATASAALLTALRPRPYPTNSGYGRPPDTGYGQPLPYEPTDEAPHKGVGPRRPRPVWPRPTWPRPEFPPPIHGHPGDVPIRPSDPDYPIVPGEPDPEQTGAFPVVPGKPDPAHTFPDTGTRQAWPSLVFPAAVAADEQFDIVVGIGPRQDIELFGTGAFAVPDTSVMLEVVLMYDPTAFRPVGWANPIRLAITPTVPYPVATVRMTALGDPNLRARRDIGASFYVDGGLRGYASRSIEVTGSPSGVVPLFDGGLLDIGPLLAQDAPDLVVIVERGEDLRGQTLLWSTRSTVPGVPAAPGPFRSEIGEDPAAFARRVRLDVGAFGGDARGTTLKLIGVGRTIAEHIPDEVCAVLAATAAARDPAPATVLLLSSEPHVPWELAVLDPPPPGSPFLGSAMAIGRWVLARRKPRPTPPTQVRADRHLVVTARYEGVPGWARLPSAEAEAEALRAAYPPAVEVQPLHSAVLDCLEAGPAAGVLHFALHGKYDPENAQDGLVLLAPSAADPTRLVPRFLQPDQVSAMEFTTAPFVFLNACQVGAAGEVLGDYSGLAKAFLYAGAAGVVAPLWNVNDEAASAIAEAFYRDAYGPNALPPAEILRRARAKVTRTDFPDWPATTLAYQFFGHPRLRLRRDQGVPNG
ncbi:CHAT domain-containing protein [Actinokineospora sp. HUAS TT18]|uniref:CHAT domain-containing protein n=1 Tax=Actinokineospora sp. HUAS TT18 TaxID=3447451 RepID=UPI003F51FECA